MQRNRWCTKVSAAVLLAGLMGTGTASAMPSVQAGNVAATPLLGSMPEEPHVDQIAQQPDSPPMPDQPEPLAGTNWELISYTDTEGQTVPAVAENNRIAYLRFSEAGQLNGNAGCNNFFASYSLGSDAGTLTISPGGSTLMACFPAAVTVQEQAVLTGLSQVATYSIDSEQLQLKDGDGQVLFTLQAQLPVALEGTTWQLTGYDNGKNAIASPIADTAITATFDANSKRVSGSAGCNQYFASYTIMEQDLSFGPAGSTRIACPGDIGNQEFTFLNLLGRVQSYVIEGEQLQWFDAESQLIATFEAQV